MAHLPSFDLRGSARQLGMKNYIICLKSVIFSAAVVFAILSYGCAVPCPHTSVRSFEITGRVVDDQTGLPIAGARIQPLDYIRRTNSVPTIIPDLSITPVAVSEADGRFKLPGTKNMLWTKTVLAPCYVGVEDGKRYSLYIVTKAGYVPSDLSPAFLDRDTNHLKESRFTVGDIHLSAGDSLVPKSWQHTSK
jgi:hypothetical protein